MEKNIFKNAYFGKAYKTRDGQKAIYVKDRFVHEALSRTDVLVAQLMLETGDILEVVKEPGVSNGIQILYENLDIVSEWEEEIDEKVLNELANNYRCEAFTTPVTDGKNIDTYVKSMDINEYVNLCEISFKAGYRKAMKG